MCEFCRRQHKTAAMHFANQVRSADQLAAVVRQSFPYALRPYCCPVCGRFLQDHERRPMNAACTRSLCETDYNRLFAGNVSSACKICGGQLDPAKISAQQANPREVRNHIHEGDCLALWALIHNVAHGSPEFAQRYQQQLQPDAYSYDRHDHYGNHKHNHRQMDDDVIDAVYHEVHPNSQHSQPIGALPSPMPMLGYHPQQTLGNVLHGFDFGLSRNNRQGRDDAVKVMRVPRRVYSY